jgi:spoIIIJ-associated protein
MENETKNGLDSNQAPEQGDEQKEFKGKNLEEAISLAEHRLKTPREKLNYEIVTEKTRLFGIKSKEIVIRAWPRQEEGERRVEDFLRELMEHFPLEISYEVKRKSDFIFVVFDGPDKAMLLRSDGALLLSLQHILNKISSLKVQVDCEFFKRRKERKLKEYAQDVARQVAETGREEILEPMNPYERRIVHIAVNQVPGITSESIGDGFLKKVKIFQTEKH